MRATSYSDLRKNLSKYLDQVSDDHVPLIVTRSGGKPAAVLLSLEDYDSLDATLHLMSTRANAKNLDESIAQLEAGKGKVRQLVE